MYDPNYYCCDCGKRMGTMSHDVVDSLGVSYYDDMMCRTCQNEELAEQQRLDEEYELEVEMFDGSDDEYD